MRLRHDQCRLVAHSLLHSININDYADDTHLDPPYPLKYECHTYHIPLEALEAQSDPRLVPNSQEYINHALAQARGFNHVYMMRSSTPISSVSLDDVYGVPCVSAVKQPVTIMFKPLAVPSVAPSMVTILPLPNLEVFVSAFLYTCTCAI